MRRSLVLIPAFVLFAVPLLAFPGSDREAPKGLFIHVENGRVTLKARQVPHGQILESLAQQLGFKLIMTGSLDERRSLEFHRKPWEEAVTMALSPTNWVLVYKSTAGASRLAAVFVLSSVPSPSLPPPPPPAPQARADQGLHQEELQSLLLRLLEANDEETRATILSNLASLAEEEEVRALQQLAQDEEAWLQLQGVALEALLELDSLEALPKPLGEETTLPARTSSQKDWSSISKSAR